MHKKSIFPVLTFFLGIAAVLAVSATSSTEAPDTTETSKEPLTEIQSTVNCFAQVPEMLDFAGEPVPLDDVEVYERLDKELQINTYFHSSTIRHIKLANRWFPVIEPILKQYGIPDDFKYLAVAESGLQNGISPAGATGFWQFLKSTGQEYGLIINGDVDERYHPIKATEAACRYLNNAHEKFGNWTLVAASYNMGMSGVQRETREQQQDNYYDLLLNSETSRYVFRILALKTILSNPSNYGFCFEEGDLYTTVQTRVVEIDTTIPDLVQFSKQHGTSYKTLKYLNPWLRSDDLTVHPGQQYTIALPAS